jgi:hypothetical protein
MGTHPLTIALVAVGSTLLTILLTPRLQHHFWKLQRRDELRLAAINEYNRLTNAYVAACLAQTDPGRPVEEWLRDLNTARATIRVFFSADANRAAEGIDKMIKPYAWWQRPDKRKLLDEFAEMCHAALTALYSEVIDWIGRPTLPIAFSSASRPAAMGDEPRNRW